MKKVFSIMRKAKVAFLTGILVAGASYSGFSQCGQLTKTLTLQPGNGMGKDAYLQSRQPNLNGGSQIDFTAQAWTHTGTPFIIRSLLSFDLSGIPAGADIIKAELNLRAPTTGSASHSQISGSNASALYRVIDPWNENTVTWNTQPPVSTGSGAEDVVKLPAISVGNMMGIDLTKMVTFWHQNPANCNGVMIKLDNEAHYRSVAFASSDHPQITGEGAQQVWPELRVTYQFTPDTENAVIREDAMVENINPGGSNPGSDIMGAYIDGTDTASSYFKFDLSNIPYGSTIHSATLRLFADPSSPNQHWGNNEINIMGVSNNVGYQWDENTLTWNNRPPSTTALTGVGVLNPGDDLVADVTSHVHFMLTDPSYPGLSNNGFEISLKTTWSQFYGAVYFATSNNADVRLHPQLEVCYTKPNNCQCRLSIKGNQATTTIIKDEIAISAYPNPAKEFFSIESDELGKEYTLFNYLGQEVKKGALDSGKAKVNTQDLKKGIYYIHVKSGDKISKQQIEIE